MELRPYQLTASEWLAEHSQALLADEMGLGKTCELIRGADLVRRRRIVIVCPVILCQHWLDEIHRWSDHWATARLTGTRMTDLAARLQSDHLWPGTEAVVLNYDILHAYDQVLGAWADLVIFDESHYLKNKGEFVGTHIKGVRRTAHASRLSQMVRNHGGSVWLATGTPMPSKPVELYSQLKILGVTNKLGFDWEYYITRYCDGKLVWVPQRNGKPRRVWKYDGATNLKELRTKLDKSVMLRRMRRDVMPDITVMPPALVSVPLDPMIMTEYAAAEKNITDYMGQRAYEIACAIGSATPDNDAVIARMKAEAAKHLVELSQLRRLAGEAKADSVISWVREWLEGGSGLGHGRKLVLFGHHRSTLETIATAFRTTAVIGGVSNNIRDQVISDFQNNPNTRLIVLSTQAAGIGLNLTASSDVVFSEYEWTSASHRQATDRCARHGQKNPVSVTYLVARETIDAYMATHIANQMAVVDAVFGANDVASEVIKELIINA